jgi:glycosyltransferase involved in cell wall biosynthesis
VEAVIYAPSSGRDPELNFPLNKYVTYKGIPVKLLKMSRVNRWVYYGWSYALFKALSHDIRKYDLVHIHSIFLFHTLMGSTISHKYVMPYILRPHGSLMPDSLKMGRTRLKRLYLDLIEKRNIARASGIHFTSDVEEEKTLSMGFNIPRSFVVPNAIDPSDFNMRESLGSFREKFPSLKNKSLILFLGRVAPEKGLDTLVSAFARTIRKNSNAHLVIVGPDDHKHSIEVKGWTQREGIESSVTFVGPLYGENKIAALRDCQIFVLPSYGTENFGIAAVEAMYCGLPVVLTENVGIHRAVSRQEAGFVVKKDPEALSQALIELLRDESLRRKMGINGRKLVEDSYTGERVAQQMKGIYEQILSEHRRG